MKKGDLLRNKQTGEFATIVSKPWTKLFRDSNDWNAMREGGGDYATAAIAIRISWIGRAYKKTYKLSDARRLFEVISESR